jgi:hypothetical protein
LGGFDINSLIYHKKIRPVAVNYVKGIVYDEDNKSKLMP